MMYNPDNWVVVYFKTENPHYRVVAGWGGGYTTGNSWKMSSGIVGVTINEDKFTFTGYSGSTYLCHKDSYCFRLNNAHVWDMLVKKHGDNVEIVDEFVDWKNMDWII